MRLSGRNKMKGNARGNWDPREGQQPFRPNPNGVGDRTNTLRRLLIGAVLRHVYLHCTIWLPSPDAALSPHPPLLIPRLPILYLLPLPPHLHPLLLAALLSLTLSGFFNDLAHLSLSGFLDSLLCVLIALTSGLAFSLLMPRTLSAAWSFHQAGPILF